MERRPARGGYRDRALQQGSTAGRTNRDRDRDKGRTGRELTMRKEHSGHRTGAWCRRSSSTYPRTTEFRKRNPAEIPGPASQLEDSPSRRPQARQRAACALKRRSAERRRTTKERKDRGAEKSPPAGAWRAIPTTRRWNEFVSPGRITKELYQASVASRRFSVSLSPTRLLTNSTISSVT